MKKYIIRILLFFLPLLFIGVTMELLLRNIPNDYQFKKSQLEKNVEEIETLILGNSHSFFGVNPEYFTTKAFNASQFSQPLNYDFELLKKYEDQLDKLETVVIPISYPSLFLNLETHAESWRIKDYVLYYNMNTSYSLKHNFELFNKKLNVSYRKIKSYYISGTSNIRSNELGFLFVKTKKSNTLKDLEEKGQTAAERHTFNLNEETNQKTLNKNISILTSIIEWGKQRGVKILFFTPPAHITYRDNIESSQLNKTIDVMQNTTSQYNNSFYINLLDDKRFVDVDFHDADHLSKDGAKKLSVLLNDLISSIDKELQLNIK